MVEFSIVIPTCDRVERLQRAMRSIDAQDLPAGVAVEIIVVNDGKAGCLPNLGSRFPIKLVETGGYTGPAAARNRGVEASTGEWIVFLDDDDVFSPLKITRLLELARNHDVICNGAEIRLVREGINYYSGAYQGDDWFQALIIRNVVGGTSRVSVRKSAFVQVGGFRDDIVALEDHELWIRLAKANMRFTAVNEALTIYECLTQKASVSKDVEKYRQAARQLRCLYHDSYELLSPTERMQHKVWIQSILAQKHLLNGQSMSASKLYWNAYWRSGSTKFAAMSALAAIWPTGMFRVRKWLS